MKEPDREGPLGQLWESGKASQRGDRGASWKEKQELAREGQWGEGVAGGFLAEITLLSQRSWCLVAEKESVQLSPTSTLWSLLVSRGILSSPKGM